MTSHKKIITIFEAFHLASLQIITFDHFLNSTSHFEINAWNFWYFNFESKLLAFWAPYILIQSLSLFSSQILVRVTAFAAHYLFSFWDLHWLSCLSKNIKSVGRYIGTSLCMYQNHQNHGPIIHNSLKINLQQSHIDFKIFPTKIEVHAWQAKLVNALRH